jgi:two-component system, cell cycle sensor histidine kinase and response regulator CckA
MPGPGKRYKILIVDDVPANVNVLVKALAPEYRLSVATRAQDALKIAGSEKPPDLILLDIMMPEMDGYEVCRRLKSEEKSARIPVIFVTARTQEIDEERGFEIGAADYITKPFRIPIVKARVKSQLDRKKAEETELELERLGAIAELASGVAHHFNNMLQVIMGGASVGLMKLEQGEIDGAKSMLRQIIESSRFGAETVKRLGDFVRMRVGKPVPDRVFDLSHTTAQAIEIAKHWLESTPERKGRDIRVISELTEGCFVDGKESEFFEIISNLVRNAMEAMPDGGELRVETFVNGEQVTLQVRDTGVGIPREHLGKIFEPFFTTKGFQRVGMGLATAYGIARRHGGDIFVESDQGKGATLIVNLPLTEIQPRGAEPATCFTAGTGLRILVIDDVEPIAKMLSELLAEFGYDVVESLTGEHGLEVFREQSIDLVICDLGMPGIGGWEVGRNIKQICEERRVPKVPFILLTGWGGQLDEKTKLEESGVDAVVEKPLDPYRLRSVIEDLGQKRSAQA